MKKTAIKPEELAKKFQAGFIGFVGEFRFSSAETMKWRDKTTGKAMTAPILRHTVETATATVSITERVEDDFDVKAFVPEFKKGDRVMVELTELENERGSLKGRGTLTPLG